MMFNYYYRNYESTSIIKSLILVYYCIKIVTEWRRVWAIQAKSYAQMSLYINIVPRPKVINGHDYTSWLCANVQSWSSLRCTNTLKSRMLIIYKKMSRQKCLYNIMNSSCRGYFFADACFNITIYRGFRDLKVWRRVCMHSIISIFRLLWMNRNKWCILAIQIIDCANIFNSASESMRVCGKIKAQITKIV